MARSLSRALFVSNSEAAGAEAAQPAVETSSGCDLDTICEGSTRR